MALLLAPCLRCMGQAATLPVERGEKATIAVDARLVLVPAVVFDKKGVVRSLTKDDFALQLDGKPQTVRYFDTGDDVPLTMGLLVDVSRSQTGGIDEEQKASQSFLDTFLQPAKAGRPADKAFIMQFAHAAELLQDLTDSHTLLANGIKEVGTQAPGDRDEEASTQSTSAGPGSGGNGTNNGGNGSYGRRSGYPGGTGGGRSPGEGREPRATGGTVLYDSLFLASDEVMQKQKGRRALIVLTDGVDRHSKESLKEAIEAAQRADTVVYAIYYKGRDQAPMWNGNRSYGGYDPYGRYPPTTGGSTDPGTYRDPDGRKILQQITSETGGRMFEWKGKGSVDDIYRQIGDELRAQYRLGFTPSPEAGGTGFHTLELTLTNPAYRKLEIQTRNGVYLGAPKPQ